MVVKELMCNAVEWSQILQHENSILIMLLHECLLQQKTVTAIQHAHIDLADDILCTGNSDNKYQYCYNGLRIAKSADIDEC